MRKGKKSEMQPQLRLALHLCIHAALGMVLLLGVVLLGAVLIEKGTISLEAGRIVGLLGVTLGGCLAGGLTALREKGRLLPYAGLTALVYGGVLLLLGAILFSETWLSGGTLMMLVFAVGGCLLGALLRLGFSSRKKRRR